MELTPRDLTVSACLFVQRNAAGTALYPIHPTAAAPRATLPSWPLAGMVSQGAQTAPATSAVPTKTRHAGMEVSARTPASALSAQAGAGMASSRVNTKDAPVPSALKSSAGMASSPNRVTDAIALAAPPSSVAGICPGTQQLANVIGAPSISVGTARRLSSSTARVRSAPRAGTD
jgi:hypothetical protein